jgi:hypothetical protein
MSAARDGLDVLYAYVSALGGRKWLLHIIRPALANADLFTQLMGLLTQRLRKVGLQPVIELLDGCERPRLR